MELRYLVEFKVIPTMLFEQSENFIGSILDKKETYMTQIYDYVCKNADMENPYTDSDFRVTVFTPNEEQSVYIIHMPESGLEAPFCRRVFIIVDNSEEKSVLRYFTVEYSDENTSMLGEVNSDGIHINYGSVSDDVLQKTVYELAFGWEDYIELNETAELREDVLQACGDWEAREYTEQIYIPYLCLDKTGEFAATFVTQGGYFFSCLYNRVAQLMERDIRFYAEDFDVKAYVYGEDQGIICIAQLPRENLQDWDFRQMCFVLDLETMDVVLLAVGKDEDGKEYLYQLDADTGEYIEKASVSDNTQELLDLIVQTALISDTQTKSQYQYISAKCPMCQQTISLGLLPDELEGYRKFTGEDEDIQDVLPQLDLFEREFLITGMCPECQANLFGKELPDDLSRWMRG